ncbi:Por secretion system C-terminal sorting domain-containing protein [Chishuiella changwenlii]|uniref:Por secretion system C-terminal sorting domain-containing protein n=3 Tax=Chishuiella changwenlii TaxID=1434701 RepID=A0A1M6SYK7_9FLAO|nr:hypothetical protein GCM10010984_27490 [Chishuiella changwenlii]SHK49805.1 Por secretion system C-terminal sorting domain-containing protein [Chishuiella changwenlii]
MIMNKKLLSITFFTFLLNVSYAQNKQELLEKFRLQKEKNEALFNKKQNKSLRKLIDRDITTIVAATDQFIVYNKLIDDRANSASNIEALQNGFINGFSLNGENMEITIFDGGRILSTHQEFRDLDNPDQNRITDLENGAQELNSHAIFVAGVIAGEGFVDVTLTDSQTGEQIQTPHIAKGVLPKTKISSAGYNDINGLNVHQKILSFGKHISNHSYAAELGWSIISDQTHETGQGLLFSTPVAYLSSPNETLFGVYHEADSNFDLISYQFPTYTIVKGAGNEYGYGPGTYASFNYNLYKEDGIKFEEGDLIPHDNCQTGAYCIGLGSLAKNIIVVGAIDIPQTGDNKVTSSSEIIHSSYSSAGPRKDGAIKPDLVAVGTRVIGPTLPNNTSYIIGSGTSYSSPKVTGVVGAITQLKRLLTGDSTYYFNSDEVKAFLLHTTQEAGLFDGPDNKFGWGLLDAKKAAETVLAAHNKEIVFERNEKVSGINYEKLITANNDKELKVTVTWIDPAAKNILEKIEDLVHDTSSKLVNDLDVRVFDTETNEEHLPWKLDLANVTGAAIKGDNTVDNIEQILIKNPVAGRKYKVVVSNKGDLIDDNDALSNQNYTLLITGITLENLNTDEVNVKSITSVYPTIAKDIIHVKTTEKIQKVDVIDLTGKLVLSTKTDRVNVSSLPVGVYIINITTDKGVTTKKIVKQ